VSAAADVVEEAKGGYHLQYIHYYVERRWGGGVREAAVKKRFCENTQGKENAHTHTYLGVYI